MDTTERDIIRGYLAELERWPAASLQEVIQKQQLAAKYIEQLKTFISETTENRNSSGFVGVATCVKRATNNPEWE